MFDLDLKIFSFIYSNCRSLGRVFYLGAFEGFVMYSSLILLAVVKVKESNSKKAQK